MTPDTISSCLLYASFTLSFLSLFFVKDGTKWVPIAGITCVVAFLLLISIQSSDIRHQCSDRKVNETQK